jgi:hypothetical protein
MPEVSVTVTGDPGDILQLLHGAIHERLTGRTGATHNPAEQAYNRKAISRDKRAGRSARGAITFQRQVRQRHTQPQQDRQRSTSAAKREKNNSSARSKTYSYSLATSPEGRAVRRRIAEKTQQQKDADERDHELWDRYYYHESGETRWARGPNPPIAPTPPIFLPPTEPPPPCHALNPGAETARLENVVGSTLVTVKEERMEVKEEPIPTPAQEVALTRLAQRRQRIREEREETERRGAEIQALQNRRRQRSLSNSL